MKFASGIDVVIAEIVDLSPLVSESSFLSTYPSQKIRRFCERHVFVCMMRVSNKGHDAFPLVALGRRTSRVPPSKVCKMTRKSML